MCRGQISSTALVRYRLVDYSAPAAHAHKKVMDDRAMSTGSRSRSAPMIDRPPSALLCPLGDVVYDPLH